MRPLLSNDYEFKAPILFYIKKTIRILPTYLLTLILSSILGAIRMSDVPKHLVGVSGDIHFWYMAVTIRIYLVWPLLEYCLSKIKKYCMKIGISFELCYFLLLIFTSVILALIFPFIDYPENSISIWWYMPVFFMGMIIAILWERKVFGKFIRIVRKHGDMFACIGVIGLVLVTPVVREKLCGYEPSNWLQNKYLLGGFLWSLIILGILYGRNLGPWLSKCFWFNKIGKHSYSIYLFHYVILLWIVGLGFSAVTNLLIMVLCTFVLTIIVDSVIDKLNIYWYRKISVLDRIK